MSKKNRKKKEVKKDTLSRVIAFSALIISVVSLSWNIFVFNLQDKENVKAKAVIDWDMDIEYYGAIIKFDIINSGYKDVYIDKPRLCFEKNEKGYSTIEGYSLPNNKIDYPFKILPKGKHTIAYEINKIAPNIEKIEKENNVSINELFILFRTTSDNVYTSNRLKISDVKNRNTPFLSIDHYRTAYERNEEEKKSIIRIIKLASPPDYLERSFRNISAILSGGDLNIQKRLAMHCVTLRDEDYITWDGPRDIINLNDKIKLLKEYESKNFLEAVPPEIAQIINKQ